MRKAFEPAGEQARWKAIYPALQAMKPGEMISYWELAQLLDMGEDFDLMAVRGAFYRAAKELEEVDKRAVEVVRHKGYRVVQPKEHLVLARKQSTRATKAIKRGESKVVNVDFNGMDPEVRKAFEVTAGAFSMMREFQRRADRRIGDHDKLIADLQRGNESSRERDAELEERLSRVEERLWGSGK